MSSASQASAPKLNLIASVNGVEITTDLLDLSVSNAIASGNQDSIQLRQGLINDLIMREAIAQDVSKLGLLDNEHNGFKVKLAEQNAILDLWFANFFKAHPLTDLDIRSEYERQLALSKDPAHSTEFLVSQIVVGSESEALQLIKQIKDPSTFDILARERSLDRVSAEKGGLVGWAFSGQLAPPINEIVPTLTVGKIYPKPIQMPVGFYIIQLTNSRQISIPPFEQARDNIVRILIQRGRQQAINELMSTVKVVKPE